MANSFRRGGKGVSVFLVFLFLGAQCLFAYQAENNYWEQRRNAARRAVAPVLGSLPLGPGAIRSNPITSSFSTPPKAGAGLPAVVAGSLPPVFLKEQAGLLSELSPAYGTIRKVALPVSPRLGGPVVFHIHDVHMNAEAQWNIRETVRSLIQSGRINLVALEGASEQIDLQSLLDFPNRHAVEMAADFLLKENKISGPIHAALTAKGKLPQILGVEDPARYKANIQAYRDSVPKHELARQQISSIQMDIETQKKSVYSTVLQTLDQHVQQYRNGKLSLGDYARVLLEGTDAFSALPGKGGGKKEKASRLGGVTKSVQEGGAISRFLTALDMERSLDFKKVESERAALVERLTQTLTAEETRRLVDQSLAYRSGHVRYVDFYGELNQLCRKKGISLNTYAALDAYIQYVMIADAIDPERLMADLAALENAAYARHTITPEEKSLVDRSRRAWLTRKLLDFSLTPPEWEEYDKGARLLNPILLSSFENFYKEARARDRAMADNLLTAIKGVSASKTRPEPSVALLVTGGFHAEGMARQLTRQGATVISYVPKIEKVDTAQGAASLGVFTQEKTPLEKLFVGDKLFLAASPLSTSAKKYMAAVVTMAAVYLTGTLAGIDPQAIYVSLGGVGVLSVVAITRDAVRSKIRGPTGEVETGVEFINGRIANVKQAVNRGAVWKTTMDFVKQQFPLNLRVDFKQIAQEMIFVLPLLAGVFAIWFGDPSLQDVGLLLGTVTPIQKLNKTLKDKGLDFIEATQNLVNFIPAGAEESQKVFAFMSQLAENKYGESLSGDYTLSKQPEPLISGDDIQRLWEQFNEEGDSFFDVDPLDRALRLRAGPNADEALVSYMKSWPMDWKVFVISWLNELRGQNPSFVSIHLDFFTKTMGNIMLLEDEDNPMFFSSTTRNLLSRGARVEGIENIVDQLGPLNEGVFLLWIGLQNIIDGQKIEDRFLSWKDSTGRLDNLFQLYVWGAPSLGDNSAKDFLEIIGPHVLAIFNLSDNKFSSLIQSGDPNHFDFDGFITKILRDEQINREQGYEVRLAAAMGLPEIGGKIQVYCDPYLTDDIETEVDRMGYDVFRHDLKGEVVLTVLMPVMATAVVSAQNALNVISRLKEKFQKEAPRIEYQVTLGGEFSDEIKFISLAYWLTGRHLFEPAKNPFHYPSDAPGIAIRGVDVNRLSEHHPLRKTGERTDVRGRVYDLSSVSLKVLAQDLESDLRFVQLMATALSKKQIPETARAAWENQLVHLFEKFKTDLIAIVRGVSPEAATKLENRPWLASENQQTWDTNVYPALKAIFDSLTSREETEKRKNETRRLLIQLKKDYVNKIQSILSGKELLDKVSSRVYPSGRATGWIGVAMARAKAHFAWWTTGQTTAKSKDEFIKDFVMKNVSDSEDFANALVVIGLGLVAGFNIDLLSWLSLVLLSPPLSVFAVPVLIGGVWFFLFMFSHVTFKDFAKKYTGEYPSVKKAAQLFGAYLVPLIVAPIAGHLLSPFGTLAVFFTVVSLPFIFSEVFVKPIHKRINRSHRENSWGKALSGLLVKERLRNNREWIAANLPGLDESQQSAASEILENVNGRPITLGLAQMRELVFLTAQKHAQRSDVQAFSLSAPAAPWSSAVKMMFVSQSSLTFEGLENLQELTAKDENIFVLSDAPIEGLPQDRAFVLSFHSLPLGSENDPFKEVPLAEVRALLQGLAPQHPLHSLSARLVLLHTPDLQLNGEGLDPTDPLREAMKSPLVVLLESMRAFPVLNQAWQDSLQALRALAKFA